MQLPTWLCGGGYDNYWFLGRWRRRTQNLAGSTSLIADYVALSLATAKDGKIRVPVNTVATLERQEVERVGQQMARERGLAYVPANAGEYVSGRLAGAASLVSGASSYVRDQVQDGVEYCHDRQRPRLSTRALATPSREAHRPAYCRTYARRRWHRVDLWKEQGPEPVAPPSHNAQARFELRSRLTMLKPTKGMDDGSP
jgi:hypothetical protein